MRMYTALLVAASLLAQCSHPAYAKAVKVKGKASQAQSSTAAKDDGPDLPYSCSTVRMAASMFTRAYIERQAKARGITPKQRRQAEDCLRGT